MYPDPKRVKRHRVTTNLDEYEQDLINALVNYTGIDQAALVRELVMRAAVSVLMETDPLNVPGQRA